MDKHKHHFTCIYSFYFDANWITDVLGYYFRIVIIVILGAVCRRLGNTL